jgi:hypothetical protein
MALRLLASRPPDHSTRFFPFSILSALIMSEEFLVSVRLPMKSGSQFCENRQISRAAEPRRRITGAQQQKEEPKEDLSRRLARCAGDSFWCADKTLQMLNIQHTNKLFS